eukprot:scaffold23325_cov127-Isochrysis_galbana.AAC.4
MGTARLHAQARWGGRCKLCENWPRLRVADSAAWTRRGGRLLDPRITTDTSMCEVPRHRDLSMHALCYDAERE